MIDYDLEFELPLAQLGEQVTALQQKDELLTSQEREQLQNLLEALQQQTKTLYQNLTSWQTVQVARHKDRPYTADYIRLMCDDFFEFHGDRAFRDDPSIIAGLAKLDGYAVMVIGQQKGRTRQEKEFRNYGMSHPEGYRKAYRLMQVAEKLHLPLVCFIDTAGAFPGLEDEEHGQGGAIAANLSLMSRLRTPILAVVIGEGGSGGALGISIADRLLMLEHSIYTVAAPEAAASILWRDKVYAPEAAEAMQISARALLGTSIIDELVPEPLGGAHRNHRLAAGFLKATLLKHLIPLKQLSIDELLAQRYRKLRAIGPFERAGTGPRQDRKEKS